jgi:hypothetical protein
MRGPKGNHEVNRAVEFISMSYFEKLVAGAVSLCGQHRQIVCSDGIIDPRFPAMDSSPESYKYGPEKAMGIEIQSVEKRTLVLVAVGGVIGQHAYILQVGLHVIVLWSCCERAVTNSEFGVCDISRNDLWWNQ